MLKLILLASLLAPLIFRAKAGEMHTSKKGNLFYLERQVPLTWRDALDECTTRNMNLLTPDTEEKQLEITELVSSLDIWYFWTAGLEIQNLQFIWITTGDNLTYSNWWEGEPTRDGSGNESQCIGYINNQWKSYKCSDLRMFICEEIPIKKEKTPEANDNSRPPLSNEMRELNESMKKLGCDNHIITELDVLLKSHEKRRETMSDDQRREISDLKNKNEQYLNQLSVAKAQLELKSKEIEMVEEFNKIQLRLLEDKYKLYTGFVEGVQQLFQKLDISK